MAEVSAAWSTVVLHEATCVEKNLVVHLTHTRSPLLCSLRTRPQRVLPSLSAYGDAFSNQKHWIESEIGTLSSKRRHTALEFYSVLSVLFEELTVSETPSILSVTRAVCGLQRAASTFGVALKSFSS